MKRQLSQGSLQGQNINILTITKSEYILAKHLPTHNALKAIVPEAVGVMNFPSGLPVDPRVAFPSTVQDESVIEDPNALNGRLSLRHEHEALKSDYVNLNKVYNEKLKQHSNLANDHDNLQRQHDQLQQDHDTILYQHNILMDDNQTLRNDN